MQKSFVPLPHLRGRVEDSRAYVLGQLQFDCPHSAEKNNCFDRIFTQMRFSIVKGKEQTLDLQFVRWGMGLIAGH